MKTEKEANKWKAGDLAWIATVDILGEGVYATEVRIERPHGAKEVLLTKACPVMGYSKRVLSERLSATAGEAFERLAAGLSKKADVLREQITETEKLLAKAREEVARVRR